MSSTTKMLPSTDPGAADVRPVPKMIEHDDPGGVICTTTEVITGGDVGVFTALERVGVERLRSVDIGDGNDDDFEFQVHGRDSPLS